MLLYGSMHSQTKVSLASGNWSDPTKWSPSGVPTFTDDVTIDAGHSMLIDISAACNSLNIGAGTGNSHLAFSGNTSLTFTVNSDIHIASACSFSILSTSNTTHSLLVNGNILNNGSIRLYQDANSLCDVVFTKNGNQTVSGTGALTRFNLIHLNMGSSVNNVLEISTPSFSVANNFLSLSNGTFKLSSPGSVIIEPFRFLTTIPATAGFWLNSPLIVASTNAGVKLNGNLSLTAGQLNIGNGQNEDLEISGGNLSIHGGTLHVAGKCYANSISSSIDMSAGQLKCPVVGSTNTTISPLHISAAGSSLTMSGGLMTIEREGGNGSQDLGLFISNVGSAAISNGTVQLGSSNTPVNQTISIQTSVALPNLEINSSNVRARIVANDLDVLHAVSILSGTFLSNGFDIRLGGNWLNLDAFDPSNATVTFSSNTSQTISGLNSLQTFNILNMVGTGIKTFSSSVHCTGNFSIGSGATIDLANTSNTLTLQGHLSNDGSIQPGNSLVVFSSGSLQTCTGSAEVSFHDLSIQNSAGVNFGVPGNVDGTLSLVSGTLNMNGNLLTLVSNASNTGRIAEITGTGDLVGTVNVQRFIPGGSTGWVFLGAPITSALTLNDWDDDLYISCPSCPDGYVANFSSVYTYDETVAGTYDAAGSYVPLNSINDPIVSTKGYWVYLGDGQVTTNDITLDVSGTVRKFGFTIPLNYTNNGSAFDDGWNLIYNPYPSSISWTALKGTTPNIDNAIYVYNPDLSSGSGAYASYVNGISSPALGSGGIGDHIAMCQGFYVHATGATSLTAQESNKVATNQPFIKATSASDKFLFRIGLVKDSSVIDETVLYFQEGAHKTFDPAFDALKLRASDPLAPQISLTTDALDFQINAAEPFENHFNILLKTTSGSSGTYKIKLLEKPTTPYGMCLNLFDKSTLSTTDLLKEELTFYLEDTTSVSRFELTLKLLKLNIDSRVTQPSCTAPNDGLIAVKGTNNGPWNFLWKKDGQVIKESRGKGLYDSLTHLSDGLVTLEVNTDGLCDNNMSTYSIAHKVPVKANFMGSDTLYLTHASTETFTNTSSNASHNYWSTDFNDQRSNEVSPTFMFTRAGIFGVKLICESATGCVDSLQKNMVVMDSVHQTPESSIASAITLKRTGKHQFTIEGDLKEKGKTLLRVFLLDGRELLRYETAERSSINIPFYIQEQHSGVIIVSLETSNERWYWKIVVN